MFLENSKHGCHAIGLLSGQVFRFGAILRNIKELHLFGVPVIEDLEITLTHSALRVLDLHSHMPHHAINRSAHLRGSGRWSQHVLPTTTLHTCGRRGSSDCQVKHGRQQVVRNHRLIAVLACTHTRPRHNQWNANSALPQIPLSTLQDFRATAIVRHVNDIGVLGDSKLFKILEYCTDACIKILCHRCTHRAIRATLRTFAALCIGSAGALILLERLYKRLRLLMHRIVRKLHIERMPFLYLLLHECMRALGDSKRLLRISRILAIAIFILGDSITQVIAHRCWRLRPLPLTKVCGVIFGAQTLQRIRQ